MWAWIFFRRNSTLLLPVHTQQTHATRSINQSRHQPEPSSHAFLHPPPRIDIYFGVIRSSSDDETHTQTISSYPYSSSNRGRDSLSKPKVASLQAKPNYGISSFGFPSSAAVPVVEVAKIWDLGLSLVGTICPFVQIFGILGTKSPKGDQNHPKKWVRVVW